MILAKQLTKMFRDVDAMFPGLFRSILLATRYQPKKLAVSEIVAIGFDRRKHFNRIRFQVTTQCVKDITFTFQGTHLNIHSLKHK